MLKADHSKHNAKHKAELNSIAVSPPSYAVACNESPDMQHIHIPSSAAPFSAPPYSPMDIDKQDKNGRTQVWIAAYNGHAKAIAALYASGANVNMRRNDGVTPVFLAAYKRHVQAISALHVAGADVNTPRNDGVTPVFMAASKGHIAAVTVLLEAGAASTKTKWGTALENARQGNKPDHKQIVRLLEAHLEQYPNGIKPITAGNQELSSAATRLKQLQEQIEQDKALAQALAVAELREAKGSSVSMHVRHNAEQSQTSSCQKQAKRSW